MVVRIDNDTALNMLMDRVEHWTDDDTVCRLYEMMYESYIEGGVFDGGEFDVMVIVDNDYINYCDVVSEGDEAYEDIKKLYDEQGCGDISCEDEFNHGYSFIEAAYDDSFLVRS